MRFKLLVASLLSIPSTFAVADASFCKVVDVSDGANLGASQKTEKIVRLASNRQVEAIDPDAIASGNIKMSPNLTLLAGHG